MTTNLVGNTWAREPGRTPIDYDFYRARAAHLRREAKAAFMRSLWRQAGRALRTLAGWSIATMRPELPGSVRHENAR